MRTQILSIKSQKKTTQLSMVLNPKAVTLSKADLQISVAVTFIKSIGSELGGYLYGKIFWKSHKCHSEAS